MKNFPIKLKQKRKKLGMSQGQLSSLLNVHTQTISKWERGLQAPHSGHAMAILALIDTFSSPAEKRFNRVGRPVVRKMKGRKKNG